MSGSEVNISLPASEADTLKEFLQDSLEQLSEVEDHILLIEEEGEEAEEATNTIFRLIHSIKGTSGFFGLITIERLGHRMETLLDKLRQGARTMEPDLADCLLAGVDQLHTLLSSTLGACQSAPITDGQMEINFCEMPIDDTLEWLETEIGKQEESPAPTSQEPASPAPAPPAPVAADFEYTFPDPLKKGFGEETEIHLSDIEKVLTTARHDGRMDDEALDGLLRGLHTIKGNSGVLMSHIEPEEAREPHLINTMRLLAHETETLVQERKKQGGSAMQLADIDLLLEVHDRLHQLYDDFMAGQAVSSPCTGLIGRIKEQTTAASAPPPDFRELQEQLDRFHLQVVAFDPQQNPEKGLTNLARDLRTITGMAERAGISALVKLADDSTSVMNFLQSDWSEDNWQLMGRDLQDFGPAAQALLEQPTAPPPPKKRVEATAKKDEQQPRAAAHPPSTVKVPQERLDHLMNLIGELLVSNNALEYLTRSIARDDGRPDIAARVKELSSSVGRIGDELQASIMAVRMTPVNQVFGKFPRLIRDLSRKLNKEIRLETVGSDTELDKTVLETISDPLLHLIRNSADHGLESPEERQQAGKEPEGLIQLIACNEGQSVKIEIRDDGRGINTAKVKEKALSSGYLDEEVLARMSDSEINNLIFAAGLSTADNLSEVSGRGVGMDVVVKGINAAGGRVQVFSEAGCSTTVVMYLPLTLAVSRGLEVEVGGERYYLPLECVRETVKLPATELHFHRDNCLTVMRGEILPVYNLAALLGVEQPARPEPGETASLVVVNLAGRQSAYLVDRFLREGDYVLKPLPGAIGGLPWLSGSMITPTGKVILVLDPLKLHENE